MLFKDIVGQEQVKQLLLRSLNAGRMPHAQLLLGPAGSGKLALALAYAQRILCQNPSEFDSCGECASCNKAEKMIHPDLHYSYPTVGSKVTATSFIAEWRDAVLENPYQNINQWLQSIGAENKQGNINKDECLNIIRKLSLKSFEGAYKILILWLPEYLGKEGNRLLKLIEEPPENTLFLLVAENQELILNTILSRCQMVKVRAMQEEEIVQGLREHKELSEDQALAIARLSAGNFNEAVNLVEHAENDNAPLFLDWLRICWRGKGEEMVKWVDKFAKIGRENQKHFLQYGLHFLREYTILKITGREDVRLLAKEMETAKRMTKVLHLQQIDVLTKLFNDCSYYIERNANPKVLFLDASIQIHKILKYGVATVGYT